MRNTVADCCVDTGFVSRQPRPQYGGPPNNFNPNFYQPQQQQAPPPFQMFYQGILRYVSLPGLCDTNTNNCAWNNLNKSIDIIKLIRND